MLDLVHKHKIKVLEHGKRHSDAVGYSVDAVVDAADVQKLKKAGYQVHQHEDVDEVGRERQKEVGRGDRYRRPQGPK
jgi:hypothetical protein